MLFVDWILGVIAGGFALALCQVFSDYNYEDNSYIRHWYLFTLFWPVGLLIFVIWASLRTYRLVANIIHNR